MTRELSSAELKQKYEADYPDLNPDFIFSIPAFNVRNNEIGAILGMNQLKRLDSNVESRTKNQSLFFSGLSKEFYRTDYLFEGSSNYAFNIVLNENNPSLAEKLKRAMNEVGIENRRGSAGGGNQLRQPYLRKLYKDLYASFPETDHIHFNGFYIEQLSGIKSTRIEDLVTFFNNFAQKTHNYEVEGKFQRKGFRR